MNNINPELVVAEAKGIIERGGLSSIESNALMPAAKRVTADVTIETDGNVSIVRGPRGSGKSSLLYVKTLRAPYTHRLSRVPQTDTEWNVLTGLQGACVIQAKADDDLVAIARQAAVHDLVHFYVEVEA